MKASLIAAAAVLQDHVSVGEMLNVDNLCIPSGSLSARAQGYGTKARVMIFVSFFWSMAFLLGKLSMGG